MSETNAPFTILSIDGGGIRGIIPAVLLAELEDRTGCHVSDLFDLVAGTSTGGILALGLTCPGENGTPRYSASDLVSFYEEEGPDIFHRSGWGLFEKPRSFFDEKYNAEPIERILQERFNGAMLSAATTDVLVPSYDLESRRPYFFTSKDLRDDSSDHEDVPMWKVARATSAAPTYFEPYKLDTDTGVDYLSLVDGGVYANNPAACALVEAIAEFDAAPTDVFMVSLGTGEHMRRIPHERAQDWGLIGWARPILDVVFDGVSDTVSFQIEQILNLGTTADRRFVRLQPNLNKENDEMDNARPSNLRALKVIAHAYVDQESNRLDRVADVLRDRCS